MALGGAAGVLSNVPKAVAEKGGGAACQGCGFRTDSSTFVLSHPRGPSLGDPSLGGRLLLPKEGRSICFLVLETA